MGTPVIYFGDVVHRRLRPARHGFRHGVYFLRFCLGREGELRRAALSRNRWNLFSFHDADHGARDGSPLEPWARALLARHGAACADGEIHLQTFPRVLGYVFNPVSFWLCHDRAGRLRAVIAEVNNTFGEHHNYLITHPDRRPIVAGDWLEARKVFHVSPFCEVTGRYRFRFVDAADRSLFRIEYFDDEGLLLSTAISGRARPLGAMALARAFLAYPWMTLGVIFRIHYHALRLAWKRVPFFAKPMPPSQETTQ
jgi:DUF1365 family protein